MENEAKKNTFEVTLADGTQFTDLELNGNNFVSKNEVSPSMFLGKLSHVVITGEAEADTEGLIGEHEHMELVHCKKYGNEYWFILRDIPASELAMVKMQGNIAYLSMMTGIDLD